MWQPVRPRGTFEKTTLAPEPSWHTVEVLAVNGVLILAIDGQLLGAIGDIRDMVDGNEVPITSGPFYLESKIAGTEFRRVEQWDCDIIPPAILRALSRPDGVPSVTPVGVQKLFDGMSLDGWVSDRRGNSKASESADLLPFEIADANGGKVLRAKGQTGGGLLVMRTRTPQKDYHLHLEYQFPPSNPSTGNDFYTTVWFHMTDRTGMYLNINPRDELKLVRTHPGEAKRSFETWNQPGGRWALSMSFPKDSTKVHQTFPIYSPGAKEPGVWQSLDLYAVGDKVLFRLKGEDLRAVTGLREWTGDNSTPIEAGYVGLHSQRAGVLFRGFELRPIADIPEDLKAQISNAGR